jgi:hypothetical protein
MLARILKRVVFVILAGLFVVLAFRGSSLIIEHSNNGATFIINRFSHAVYHCTPVVCRRIANLEY